MENAPVEKPKHFDRPSFFMNLLIITNDQKVTTYRRLEEECLHRSLPIQVFNPERFTFSGLKDAPFTVPEGPCIILNRYTAIKGQDLDLDLLPQILNPHHHYSDDDDDNNNNDKNKKTHYQINDPRGLRVARNKATQGLFFKLNHIPSIPYLFIKGPLNREDILHFLTAHKAPFISKPLRGNGGRGITYFDSIKSVLSYMETCHVTNDQNFIFQPYIQSSLEYRVFMINFRPYLSIEKREGPDQWEFRKNFSRNCHLKMIKLESIDQEILNHCQLISKKLKLRFCAIDILIDNHGAPHFLEINSVPGWAYLEQYFNNQKNTRNLTAEILDQIIPKSL